MKYKFNDRLLGSWKVGAVSAETSDVKTAESYFTDLKLDYQNTLRLYSFANAGWQQNKFAGVDEHVYGGVGEGYKFLDGPAHFLIGELSIMYVADKYTDTTKKDYPGGRAFAKYTYAITEKNKFSQSLEYLNDFNDSQKIHGEFGDSGHLRVKRYFLSEGRLSCKLYKRTGTGDTEKERHHDDRGAGG